MSSAIGDTANCLIYPNTLLPLAINLTTNLTVQPSTNLKEMRTSRRDSQTIVMAPLNRSNKYPKASNKYPNTMRRHRRNHRKKDLEWTLIPRSRSIYQDDCSSGLTSRRKKAWISGQKFKAEVKDRKNRQLIRLREEENTA